MVNKIYIESEMAWPDGSCETRPCAEKNSEGVYLAAVGTSRGLSPGRFSLEGNLRGNVSVGVVSGPVMMASTTRLRYDLAQVSCECNPRIVLKINILANASGACKFSGHRVPSCNPLGPHGYAQS